MVQYSTIRYSIIHFHLFIKYTNVLYIYASIYIMPSMNITTHIVDETSTNHYYFSQRIKYV